MKINCEQQLKTLKGEPLKTSTAICPFCKKGDLQEEVITLGTVLSNIVLSPHKNKDGFRPLKAYELAKKFTNQKAVEIDNADFIQIKELAETTEGNSPIVVAQVLLMLGEVKEK